MEHLSRAIENKIDDWKFWDIEERKRVGNNDDYFPLVCRKWGPSYKHRRKKCTCVATFCARERKRLQWRSSCGFLLCLRRERHHAFHSWIEIRDTVQLSITAPFADDATKFIPHNIRVLRDKTSIITLLASAIICRWHFSLYDKQKTSNVGGPFLVLNTFKWGLSAWHSQEASPSNGTLSCGLTQCGPPSGILCTR